MAAVAQVSARVGGHVGARAGRPVRLTRRGRLVVLALLVGLVGAIFALAAAPGQAANPGGRPVAVVQPGDTLWSIAERYAPGRDRFETIAEIRQLNGLDGYTIHAGQRLVLPVRR
jgi:LysM domain